MTCVTGVVVAGVVVAVAGLAWLARSVRDELRWSDQMRASYADMNDAQHADGYPDCPECGDAVNVFDLADEDERGRPAWYCSACGRRWLKADGG